jgi:hypothetical protein
VALAAAILKGKVDVIGKGSSFGATSLGSSRL